MIDYPKGLDPYVSRQNLLHHMYSPLVSIDSSPNSDLLIQSLLNTDSSVLSILKPYGNNAQYSSPNQVFKITNTQLITKNYPSFPVRFDFPLPELLSLRNVSSSNKSLFSISSLELLLKESRVENELFLEFYNKIITSNSIVSFETFNHPIAQIFIINFEVDTIDYLRSKVVEFRNYNFPKYFQLTDLLFHVFILYDNTKHSESEVEAFENSIRDTLAMTSTPIPLQNEGDTIQIQQSVNSTIEEDLQKLSFNSESNFFNIPSKIDAVIRSSIYKFISLNLIPHMEKKVRIWDDQVLAPKKSIANKFFSVSKKLFNNQNSNDGMTAYNYQEHYYHKSSPEQAIRKLADWSLILKDFKYSYSIYDFIRKDYNNDKAWIYVASTQEMCIISLLLVQTQIINNQPNVLDKNTLRKIRFDIIEPYLDSLSYTYKSRLNLKTYNIRTMLVVAELLLCMCFTYNMYWYWIDLVEKLLVKCYQEIDNHLVSANQTLVVIKAIIYERLGYLFGKSSVESLNYFNLDLNALEPIEETDELEEGIYINQRKLKPKRAPPTKFRKSAIWYLVSMKLWLGLKRYDHVEYLLRNIKYCYGTELSDDWYDRGDLLLGFIKKCLAENNQL